MSMLSGDPADDEDLASDMDELHSTTVPTQRGRRDMLRWVADQMRKDHRAP